MDSIISKTFFQEQIPCKHQIDSFNYIIQEGIEKFIESINEWTIKDRDKKAKFQIKINLNKIDKPKHNGKDLTPQMARLNDKHYCNEVFIDATITQSSNNRRFELKGINIGAIPCLVGSDKCHSKKNTSDCEFDKGGYFIISGREKTIVSRERIVPNHLFMNKIVDKTTGITVKAECRVAPETDSLFTKVVRFNLEEKKVKGSLNKPKSIWKYLERVEGERVSPRATQHEFTIQIGGASSKSRIPLFTLFRALGIESDKAILSYIFKPDELKQNKYSKMINDLLIASVNSKGDKIYEQDKAIHSIIAKGPRFQRTKAKLEEISKYLYPNVATTREKAIMLGIHARKIIDRYLDGETEKSWTANRDNFRQKRIDVCGTLILQVFRDAVNQLRNHVIRKLSAEKELPEDNNDNKDKIQRLFTRAYVDDYMLSSFRGNWGKLNDPSKAGIVEDLDRLSYTSYISHTRRVKSPVDAALKLTDPHKLGPEQFGYFCPFESPDGANVGLIKHIASGCIITKEITATNDDLGLKSDTGFTGISSYFPTMDVTKVFRNNTIVGFHDDPRALYEYLISERRTKPKLNFISFYFDVFANEFHIFTDAGRSMRPLFIVENIQNAMKKNKFEIGIDYDYVELAESNYHLIASDQSKITKYTRYCEISPLLSLGYYMSSVPFLNHNPSARAMLGGQQAKQAIGVYSTKFRDRFDTISYVLHYPQKSLVSTRNVDGIKKNSIPNGQNVIMAIAAMGYNQEDAVIINKNSAERGMFAISAFKTLRHELISDDELRTTVQNVKFRNDNYDVDNIQLKFDEAAYNNLQDNGLPKLNRNFQDGDLLLGCMEQRNIVQGDYLYQTNEIVKKDISLTATTKHNGFVDDHKINDGVVKIKLRQYREPTLGDKLASMHGQKGVIGMLVPQDEMPFSQDGLVPDVVINPYAFPKRMTIGHVLECLFGRVATTSGTQVDGTAFDQHDFAKIHEYLESKNMNRTSNELLYNARTGHQLAAEIFIGPMYYYRLKHMVKDKMQNRANVGGTDSMTGQPAQGRAKKGGLKLGEMEMNSLVSHGASTFLKEAIIDKSDGVIREAGAKENSRHHHAYVDSQGDTLISNYEKGIVATKNTVPDDVFAVKTSKTFQVLKHELNAASIDVKLHTSCEKLEEDYVATSDEEYYIATSDEEDDSATSDEEDEEDELGISPDTTQAERENAPRESEFEGEN